MDPGQGFCHSLDCGADVRKYGGAGRYPLKLRGTDKLRRRRLASEALERAGLAGFGARRPGALSGGPQQRVALARAMIFKPRALLLDEPLSALDAGYQTAMRDEIRSVQRANNIATLHVTHDQEEALSIADKVAVLNNGRLLQMATPAELYDRAATKHAGVCLSWP